MALDASFLKLVCNELNEKLIGAKVDKVYQPERDEFVFIMRTFRETIKLRMSASSANPAVYITEHSKDNPKQAPMLCMLIRKLYIGGRFISAEQPDFERIIILKFECTDEMGDKVERRIIVEIMGRNSNIVFTDGNSRITESVKRLGSDPDAPRHIIAGMTYAYPQKQDKLAPVVITSADFDRILSASEESLSDAILHSVSGFSPIVCREIAYRICGEISAPAKRFCGSDVTPKLNEILDLLSSGKVYIVSRNSGENIDFTFFAPTLYGDTVKINEFESPSQLLDVFYYERDHAERMKQRSAELSRLVSRNIDRVIRKLEAQKNELTDCDNAEELRLRGELITANIYRIVPNSSVAVVENFYDDNNEVCIPLDCTISPQANAQKYFKAYRKSVTRINKLTEQIGLGEDELEWLRSVAVELSDADCDADILKIRDELASEGYIRIAQNKKQKDKKVDTVFESIVTSDGFTVYYGKNNMQNDELTMKFARNSDIWFHVRESFGSHVVLKTEGRAPTENAVFEAAKIAAQRSKSASGTKIPVDYTEIKNVHKPKGAKPGKVIYVNYKTIII